MPSKEDIIEILAIGDVKESEKRYVVKRWTEVCNNGKNAIIFNVFTEPEYSSPYVSRIKFSAFMKINKQANKINLITRLCHSISSFIASSLLFRSIKDEISFQKIFTNR